MTQDVQPLTWQKRTNLEEHQQFFSKINEIIDNLAPTMDEAEAAIAQATQALADANTAIATANAASSAASAAAQQAQTAAATVARYDSRLTTDEGNIAANAAGITALQGRMGTAEGKITAIEGREPGYLKKAGDPQTVTSQIMVPTTATGIRDTQIANGTRIQNDLGAYEYMVRTSGNQRPINGVKACAFIANNFVEVDGFTTSRAGWHKIYTIRSTQRWIGVLSIFKNSNDFLLSRACMYEYLIVINNASTAGVYYATRIGNEPQIRLTFDGTVWNVWVQCPAYQRTYMQLDSKAYNWGEYDAAYHVDPDYSTVTTEPAAEDYSVYKTPVTP